MRTRILARRAFFRMGLPVAGALFTAVPASGSTDTLQVHPANGWRVEASPFADLWYHGLSVVGFNGFGPNPLYDVAYGRGVVRSGPEAPLAREARALGHALAADPAFEVLHFLPLYLDDASPEQALEGLHRLTRTPRGGVNGLVGPGASGLEALAALLPGPEQRATLGRLVGALRAEWNTGLRTRLEEGRRQRAALVEELERRWQAYFLPALAPYLKAQMLETGRVLVSPALGLEGRFLQSPPGSSASNTVVVGLGPAEGGPDVTLAPVVRELCYPAVRRAFEVVKWQYADRIAASRASDAAATRCGELLLERRLPAALPAYRERFGLQGPHASPWSSLPDPVEGRAWDAALEHVLNLSGGS